MFSTNLDFNKVFTNESRTTVPPETNEEVGGVPCRGLFYK